MSRVLMTAFEPFGPWTSNASCQAIVELTRDLPASSELVTRLYPVDFQVVRQKIAEDLTDEFDCAILLGQSAQASGIEFERFAINNGADPERGCLPFKLEEHGPVAFRTDLPLESWAEEVQRQGLPAKVSNYAGDYCCNAAFYWCSNVIRERQLKTQCTFIHIPPTPQQIAENGNQGPSMESTSVARALRLVLEQLADQGPRLASPANIWPNQV